MESATTYQMSEVPWQFFGTLTFSAGKPEAIRRSMWFYLLRECGQWFGIGRKAAARRLTWVLRQEAGEITGRVHYHFLLCGLPPFAVSTKTCMSIMAQWEKLGGGMARVRMFDARLQGVEYTLKCLHSDGANAYEIRKFSGRSLDKLYLSDSLDLGHRVM
jgi:hypothetical protein